MNVDKLSQSHTLKPNFSYSHQNPYHHKLESYNHFVLRDREAEGFMGKWRSDVFQNHQPLVVEVGCGFGHFMLDYCQNYSNINFVGIDYRFKRSFNLAKKIARSRLQNIKYLRARGERLHFFFNSGEVDEIFLFFPDPWPKTKHHKKRLFQSTFLNNVHRVLKPRGKLYVKTDHDAYATHMTTLLNRDPHWSINLSTRHLHEEYPNHFLSTYKTNFEKKFLSQGMAIKAFVLEKL